MNASRMLLWSVPQQDLAQLVRPTFFQPIPWNDASCNCAL